MTYALLSECVEVQVPADEPRRVPDSELAILLADLRPSPRRAPELVKLRAEALGLTPQPAPADGRVTAWPILITVSLQVAGLITVAVIR